MTRTTKRRLVIVLSVLMVAIAGVLLTGPPKVPKAAIQSAVTRDEALLARAWELPVAATYRSRFASQSNGSYCGPASLANVFGSFGDSAISTEKQVLEGTGRCWSGYCIPGLTLDQLGEVARAHTQRKVTVLRDLTPEEFREHLRQSNDPSKRYTVNFARKAIFGAGGGHHSPIGGYLEREDFVLVLDVNAEFQPWLVERERLFKAIDTLDGDKKRGLLRIE